MTIQSATCCSFLLISRLWNCLKHSYFTLLPTGSGFMFTSFCLDIVAFELLIILPERNLLLDSTHSGSRDTLKRQIYVSFTLFCTFALCTVLLVATA